MAYRLRQVYNYPRFGRSLKARVVKVSHFAPGMI